MFILSFKTNNFHKFFYLHAVISKSDYQDRTWSFPKISTVFYLFIYVFRNTEKSGVHSRVLRVVMMVFF